jgi:hypothetical protein
MLAMAICHEQGHGRALVANLPTQTASAQVERPAAIRILHSQPPRKTDALTISAFSLIGLHPFLEGAECQCSDSEINDRAWNSDIETMDNAGCRPF